MFLADKRTSNKITQKELANRVGVSQRSISAYEKGIRKPSIKVAKKLANLLGFDWTLFYTDGEKQEGEKI